MKERPILFSAPMVRAILNGTKTQTRRVVKARKDRVIGCDLAPHEIAGEINSGDYTNCPYGQPGDRLWVREATVRVEDHGYIGPVYVESEDGRACLAGGLAPAPDDCTEVEPYELRIRPSIYMPRHFCRIVLEVTGVRAERLRNITEADARAEGIAEFIGGWACLHDDAPQIAGATPQEGFRHLWNRINGPDAWAANPWVWVVSFQAARKAAP